MKGLSLSTKKFVASLGVAALLLPGDASKRKTGHQPGSRSSEDNRSLVSANRGRGPRRQFEEFEDACRQYRRTSRRSSVVQRKVRQAIWSCASISCSRRFGAKA